MRERLGFVIHWLGFIGGMIFLISWIEMYLSDEGLFRMEDWTMLVYLVSICWGVSWLIRWILVGKVKFFPFQSNSED